MMFRYKEYMESVDGQKLKFTKFYKELLTLLSKYGYCGHKVGSYNIFEEVNKMREDILKEYQEDDKNV